MPATWTHYPHNAHHPATEVTSLRALIPLIPDGIQHLRFSCLLDPQNPNRLDPQIGGEREFERLIYYIKTKRSNLRIILECPYPHLQSGLPLSFNQDQGFHFKSELEILPVPLPHYIDILSVILKNLDHARLANHEKATLRKLTYDFQTSIIKTRQPDFGLFTNLSLWFAASPTRQQLIHNYLENLPEGHYAAFFPKTRLDLWHLKEPLIISLS